MTHICDRHREGYRDLAKGTGHAARLNVGDGFAYAITKDMNELIVFKGEDLDIERLVFVWPRRVVSDFGISLVRVVRHAGL